jgi:hypothetical protein
MITFNCIVNFSKKDVENFNENVLREKLAYEVTKQFRSHLPELTDVTTITKIERENADNFDMKFVMNLISEDEYRILKETERKYNSLLNDIKRCE